MRFGWNGLMAGVAALVAALSPAAGAATLPVQVNLTGLRAIQTNNPDKTGSDDVYVVVTGLAKGQELNQRLPEGKTWSAKPKAPAVAEKAPATVWKGELADGEFALVSVSLFHGAGKDDAKLKEYAGKIAAAGKGAAGGKTLANAADFKKVAADNLKAQQAVIVKIKDTFSREKKTDHYGGLFNILLWNNGGKLVKRLDPVGLTFGEHFGIKEKIYTKLKNTLPNVLVPADAGEWSEQSLGALSDDLKTARVKMLETEFITAPDRQVKNVTDYLADVQVMSAGKVVEWRLPDPKEGSGTDDVHMYWEYAE